MVQVVQRSQAAGLWLEIAVDSELSKLDAAAAMLMTEAGERQDRPEEDTAQRSGEIRTLQHQVTGEILKRYGINVPEEVTPGDAVSTYGFHYAGSFVRMTQSPLMTRIMTWKGSIHKPGRDTGERLYLASKLELETGGPGNPKDKFSPLGFLLHHSERAGIRDFAVRGTHMSMVLPVALELIRLPVHECHSLVGPTTQLFNDGSLEVTQPGRFSDYGVDGPQRAWRLTGEDEIIQVTGR